MEPTQKCPKMQQHISWKWFHALQITNIFLNLYNTSQICGYLVLHDKIIIPHFSTLHNTSQVHAYVALHDKTIC
jgi:hypothetical protein